MPIEPGTKLGQYEVLELIGEGAMGAVYRAYHAQLARTGAVKVMHAISPDSDSIARFRHEAQAIARMRHPNILNVFDFGEYEGTPYMIVEYVPGGNLAGRLTQGLLPWGTALRFLRGIAAGLDYAHSQGIVHRDVKPANVLLEKDETLVLADFGLAKLLQGSSLQSMTGVTTGTPAYMAPEQVTGHEVGPAADRYSLATIAYEMLTGSIPFEGQGMIELLYAHVHSDPARPSTLNPQLNEKVDAVIMRGLNKEPGSRWATCEAFVNALAGALGAKATAGIARTVAMAPAPAVERTVAIGSAPQAGEVLFAPPPTTVPPPVWAPAVAAKKRARRRRMAVIVIAVLALLALIAGSVVLLLPELFRPTLALSSSVVEPGEILTVTGDHLPANQFGQVELRSHLYTFPFGADANGSLSKSITIPTDIGIGAHHISVCWDNSCPLRAPLAVVAPGTRPTPAASAAPSLSASATPVVGATPGRSPSPGATATSQPGNGSTPTPRRSPTPRASPTPACAAPTSGATLTPSSATVVGGARVSLTGTNYTPSVTFTPSKPVTLKYYKGTSTTPFKIWTTPAGCNGRISTSVFTATTVLPRSDHVTACDAAGRCAPKVNLSIL